MRDINENALAAGQANESAKQSTQTDYNTSDQKLTYTVWLNNSGTKKSDKTQTWPEFCQWLQDLPPARVKDDCKLIKLAKFGDVRTPLRDNSDGTKSGNSLRHNDNVLAVTGIEGDYDSEKMTPEQAIEMLEGHNLKAVIAPTFSATPDTPRWRVLTPLSEQIAPDERLRYIEVLNGMLSGVLASESATLSQSFYIGVPAGAPYTVLHTFDDSEEGYTLDELDKMEGIDQHRQTLKTKRQKANGGVGGSSDAFDDTDINDWVAAICSGAEVHPNLIKIAGRFVAKGLTDKDIRAYFAPLADRVEAERGKERADLLRGKELDDAIASARAKGYAPREYAELLAEASAMDQDTAPADIEKLAVQTAVMGSVEREKILKRMKATTAINIGELRQLVTTEKRDKKKQSIDARSSNYAPMFQEQFPDIVFNEETGVSKVPATIANVEAMLKNYKVSASYDVISKKTQVIVPGMTGSPDNADNSALTRLISLAKLNDMQSEMVPAYLEAIADERQVNPVADWINSREWDGVNRLPAMCRSLEVAGDYPEELRDVLVRRWLVSAVAAALKPMGFKARGVLTLQGPQSIGKTAWLQSLVPDLHLRERLVKTDHMLDPNNKDSILGAITHWLVELGELDSSFKKDIARMKGFITADKDKVRRPYARLEAEYQRRTVFFASVNNSQFLVDETGNTRFWTIAVKRINYNHLIDMQQVWAQMAYMFEVGEQWWLTPEEEAHVEQVNKGHRAASSVRELIMAKLNFDALPAAHTKMSATEVLVRVGFDKPNNAQSREAGAVLRELLGEPTMSNGLGRWNVPRIGCIGDSGFEPIEEWQTG